MASSHKRRVSPTDTLIPNPLIKKRNLEWALESPSGNPPLSQSESVSSPVAAPSSASPSPPSPPSPPPPATPATPAAPAPVTDRPTTTTADIESGAVQIAHHLIHFASNLPKHILPSPTDIPRLPIGDYSSLYKACAGSAYGAHFVIHQHDHPIAGTHYDLRLQINETSSVSWAIMYGLPGDPNSIRLNRNATETRIHSLWNHLIETASSETGSLLIWDTGTYTILPRCSKHTPLEDPSSPPDSPQTSPATSPSPSPQALLHTAFQTRKIRLRLRGTKLPDPYVLNLRLTKSEDATGRSKRTQTRRRQGGRTSKSQHPQPETSSSDSDDSIGDVDGDDEPAALATVAVEAASISAVGRELRELEDAQVRLTNAYPGASNTIDSIHQRKWYLSLDRRACGFVETRRQGRTEWELPALVHEHNSHNESSSQENLHKENLREKTESTTDACRLSFPFYVRGPDHERSVMTGRRSSDILQDEGVTNFVPRKVWTPVLK